VVYTEVTPCKGVEASVEEIAAEAAMRAKSRRGGVDV